MNIIWLTVSICCKLQENLENETKTKWEKQQISNKKLIFKCIREYTNSSRDILLNR